MSWENTKKKVEPLSNEQDLQCKTGDELKNTVFRKDINLCDLWDKILGSRLDESQGNDWRILPFYRNKVAKIQSSTNPKFIIIII